MTILTINKKELEKKIGKLTKELEEKISMFGTPVETITDSEISIEIFPNRPDLLSTGNFIRAINQFIGKKGIVKFKISKPEKDFIVEIGKSVKIVRPHTVCAIIKGLKFDDIKIKEIVDIQEKLHNSIGRKRKKLAIGIYPLDKITLPIKFIGKKPEDIKFLPLESKIEMTGRQILKRHSAGREYGYLLKDHNVFPIFIDANNEILSMPPIINSEKTGKINEKTKDIFIECSGHNLIYLKKCLNIIIATMSEMGGKIYAMNIQDSKSGNFISPDMSPERIEFKIKDVEKTLGIKLNKRDVQNYLRKMGIEYEDKKESSIALVPAYRTDILHWIDLAEEIAIAYGYDKFKPEIPEISTIAEEDSINKSKKIINNILVSLGFLEISSFHLTTKKNAKKMHYDFKNFIEIEDSKTGRDILRIDLLTNLLQITSENSDAAYPQKIFELGKIFALPDDKNSTIENIETGIIEKEKLAIILTNEKTNFTEMKQVLDYLFKMLGIKYSIEPTDDTNYIIGRCGKIIVNKNEIGKIGEIAPRVLKNWKIKMPVVGMEIDLNPLI